MNANSILQINEYVYMSTISGLSSTEYMPSGHVGGTYDYKLSEKWYFQPELLFTSTGFNLKENLVLKGGQLRIYAIELPLIFSFRPSIGTEKKLLLDFGLYTRYGLFGKKKYDYFDFPSINKSPFDAYNRFETGLNLGLGYQKSKYYGILVFQRGLSKAEKNNEVYHQVIKFSLGYKF